MSVADLYPQVFCEGSRLIETLLPDVLISPGFEANEKSY